MFLFSMLCLSIGWFNWRAASNDRVDTRVAARVPAPALKLDTPTGLAYTNHRISKVPWSIHVVSWRRDDPAFTLHSAHAGGRAVGLSTVSEQIRRLGKQFGTPVAAVNGDFYQRDRSFAGDPRGLQIINGEVISAPADEPGFWLDEAGEPHVATVTSRFSVTWPNGKSFPAGLNQERRSSTIVLYTSAVGRSIGANGGRNLILEHEGQGPWLPLQMGQTYTARVKAIEEAEDRTVTPEELVVAVGPKQLAGIGPVEEGDILRISTASTPEMARARMAIGGGPVLVHEGRVQSFDSDRSGYQFTSRTERHPRSAVGWSKERFFFVQVDGRQRGLSVGMTLEELADYMVGLGCVEAMNLDGGGSSSIWCNGKTLNSPCDGRERGIANCLILAKRTVTDVTAAEPEQESR